MTATLVGGVLLASAVAGTGAAYAGQTMSGRSVVFAGNGLLGSLTCRSTPSVRSLLVPVRSTVRIVNRTGRMAMLLLDGAAKERVPNRGATDVLMTRGTTRLSLDPDCNIVGQTTPVVVTTQPSMPPGVPDGPDEVFPDPAGSEPAEQPATEPQPTVEPTATTPPPATHKPTNPRPTVANPHVPQRTPAATTRPVTPALPQGGAVVQGEDHTPAGTGVSTPAESRSPAAATTGVGSETPSADPVVVAAPAAPVPDEVVEPGVAEPEQVAAVRSSVPESPPIGLLALIAMVCVTGVSVGLIRAFVSQRASRTSVA